MKILWLMQTFHLTPIVLAADLQKFFSGEPPLRWSPPIKAGLPLTNIEQAWLEVPLDHFDTTNQGSFKMQYLINKQYATSYNSSLLIMVGGEWSIDPSFLLYGSMVGIAKQNGAEMMYTEHRYYGLSWPVENLSIPNLEHLSVDQALADLAYLIARIKQEDEHKKIILFGGSYAANMVVWFSQRYPYLIDGAVASSGPILAERNFYGYLKSVHETFLKEGGLVCMDILCEALQELKREMLSIDGRIRIAEAYSLCKPVSAEEPFEVEYFYAVIVWGFAGIVQTAKPGMVAQECRKLTTDELGATPFERLARYVTGTPSSCTDRSYVELIKNYADINKENGNRLWYYQTCTEFGYYQTSPKNGTIFDGLLSIEFYEEVCRLAFSEKFTSDFIESAVNTTNAKRGGLHPKVENLVSVHGLQDPWHVLGTQTDLGPTSPTLLVPKASHCFDLNEESALDTEEMAEAKKKIAEIVTKWIES